MLTGSAEELVADVFTGLVVLIIEAAEDRSSVLASGEEAVAVVLAMLLSVFCTREVSVVVAVESRSVARHCWGRLWVM